VSNPRVRRIADRIQVVVAQMLERRVKDPRLGFVTVTDVRVSGDTQHASVFYTVLDDAGNGSGGTGSGGTGSGGTGSGGTGSGGTGGTDQLAATAAALESAKGLIRSEVGKQLGMRHVPTLEFIHDALPESARHIDDLLARARESDAAVAAAAAGASYAGDADPYRRAAEEGDGEGPDIGSPDTTRR
jgi:ribosome-binding factor A